MDKFEKALKEIRVKEYYFRELKDIFNSLERSIEYWDGYEINHPDDKQYADEHIEAINMLLAHIVEKF